MVMVFMMSLMGISLPLQIYQQMEKKTCAISQRRGRDNKHLPTATMGNLFLGHYQN